MKKLALAMACVLAVGIAQADDKGGFSQDAHRRRRTNSMTAIAASRMAGS